MRIIVLYHPHSDHGGVVEDYVHEYQRFKDKSVEMISLETRNGATTATLYDISVYPAILILTDEGIAQKIWQGLPLPLMSEIDAYSFGNQSTFTNAMLSTETVV